jgi:hypothetical protein
MPVETAGVHAHTHPPRISTVLARNGRSFPGAAEPLLRGIRHGRSFTPLVTLNTWFAYGTTINEEALVAEIDRAAAMGIELLVVDAGSHRRRSWERFGFRVRPGELHYRS